MAYTKRNSLKLTQFWSFVLCIIFFIIEGIIAIAGVPIEAIIAMFIIAVIFAIVGGSIWLYFKIKATNKKITA